MLTLAQLIKLVLDEAYQEIDLDDAAKDASIATELGRLTREYGRLKNPERTVIDYASPTARFAYIYKYTVAHADYIMQLVRQHEILRDLFERPEVSVSCLGGGPGSDLLGILKYMLRNGSKSTLTSYLFDRERAWGDSWGDVARTLKAEFQLYPIFQQMDVTVPDTWKSYHKFLRADLFTLSYFLSEVWLWKDEAQEFFLHCLRSAKPGSLFLFIDNNDGSGDFAGWYDEMANACSVDRLAGGACSMAFSLEEEKRDLEPYYSKSGWPKGESNVTFRIG